MSKTIKLNSSQLIDEVVVAYGFSETKADKKGNQFGVLVHDGVAFRVEAPVFNDWKAGKLASLTLIESTREVTNTDDAGVETTATVRAFSVGGAATKAQIMANKVFDTKIAALDRMVASETGLDMEKINALETAAI